MKKCTKCKIPQELTEFNKHLGYRDKTNNWCKSCFKLYRVEYREEANRRRRIWRSNETNREIEKERELRRRISSPKVGLLNSARSRAKRDNLPYNLTTEDIIIPEVCPILGTPFIRGTMYAMSLDKIIPEKGYVRGNIIIISRKANTMKLDSSLAELTIFCKNALIVYKLE